MHNNSCNKYLYEANERKISASNKLNERIHYTIFTLERMHALYKQGPLMDECIEAPS